MNPSILRAAAQAHKAATAPAMPRVTQPARECPNHPRVYVAEGETECTWCRLQREKAYRKRNLVRTDLVAIEHDG